MLINKIANIKKQTIIIIITTSHSNYNHLHRKNLTKKRLKNTGLNSV